MTFNNYFTGVLFFCLLMWVPIDHDSSNWLSIRLLSTTIPPLLVWVFLAVLYKKSTVYNRIEPVLVQVLSGVVSLLLLYFAVIEITDYKDIPNDELYLMLVEEGRLESYVNSRRIDWAAFIVLLVGSGLFFVLGVLNLRK